MDEMIKIIFLICPMIFLAGVIDAVAGGGGLISLPAYLAVGLPPHLATATNKCSSTFGTLFSTIRFMKGKRICYLSAFVSAGVALIGSYFGAMLNMLLDEKYLRYLLLIVLPIIAVVILLKKDFGEKSSVEKLTKTKLLIDSLLIGFFVGMYDGFFGPGTGTFLILAYTVLMGFDLVTASGNAKVVNLASNLAAFFTFAIGGKIVWQIGIPAAVFGVLGNWVGSGLALKNGKKVIRPMFFLALGLLMTKIGYDLFV